MAGRFKKLWRKGKRIKRAAAVAAGIYVSTVRPWTRTWGATDSEIEETLPGDELISHPRFETTRAVTVEASPAEIWPWLVQIGQDRAGFYSYDWLENLFGLDVHSSEQVLPEYQDLDVGDLIKTSPDREGMAMEVIERREDRDLVLRTTWVPGVDQDPPVEIDADDRLWMDLSWAFALQPVGDERTRLITRMRIDYRGWPLTAFLYGVLEPAQFVMERKMLLGIKERAERGRPGGNGAGESTDKQELPPKPAVKPVEEDGGPEDAEAERDRASAG